MGSKPVWQYVTGDFLETACEVDESIHNYLFDHLSEKISGDQSVRRHASFSIAGIVIVVGENLEAHECWLFDPGTRSIQRLIAKP